MRNYSISEKFNLIHVVSLVKGLFKIQIQKLSDLLSFCAQDWIRTSTPRGAAT